jgi:glyoxylase-like metal-dependent hydrolase (beta-lactamase superfamily II)
MAPRFYSLDASHQVYPIRGLLGFCHLLIDSDARHAILIDTGLIGETSRISRILEHSGLGWSAVKTILLTHGHLDHTGCLARLKQLTGAPLLAHPAEDRHIAGTFPYRGLSRICGAMEAFGRWALRYRPAPIDEPLRDDQDLPYWAGLKVIHLPGHTQGHCGFYSSRFDLLFTGDFFASYSFSVHLPPPFLNSCPEFFDASFDRVRQISPRLVIPNHYFGFDGLLHRKRLDRLISRRAKRRAFSANENAPGNP